MSLSAEAPNSQRAMLQHHPLPQRGSAQYCSAGEIALSQGEQELARHLSLKASPRARNKFLQVYVLSDLYSKLKHTYKKLEHLVAL